MPEEEPQADATAAAGAAKSGTLRKILIIVPLALVGLAVVIGGGVFGYKKMMSQKAKPEDVIQQIGPTLPLDPIIANLGDESGDRFVKLSLVFEMSDALLQPEIEQRMPQIKHIINLTLRSKQAADLNTPKGVGLLTEEILHQVNSLLTGERTIRNVYVTDLAVQ